MNFQQRPHVQLFLVIFAVIPLRVGSVGPSRCPTNKIAPHKNIASWEQHRPRTFGGAFIDLLTPGGGPLNNPDNNLQEQPQEDDPDDCGEIEDYDETDLSSITPQSQMKKRQGRQDNRFFLNFLLNRPHQSSPTSPLTTKVTRQPTRPSSTTNPFWFGGIFANNQYRPPLPENPSDNLKPVHEYYDVAESQTTYWPQIVGGPVGNIVGASPARPTFPESTTQKIGTTRFMNKRPRLRMNNDDNIIRSFVDLLF